MNSKAIMGMFAASAEIDALRSEQPAAFNRLSIRYHHLKLTPQQENLLFLAGKQWAATQGFDYQEANRDRFLLAALGGEAEKIPNITPLEAKMGRAVCNAMNMATNYPAETTPDERLKAMMLSRRRVLAMRVHSLILSSQG